MASQPVPALPPARCLVVDDDVHVRRSLARVLQGLGLSVREAASGTEALAALAEEDVALCITDIYMPQMDGVTLLREAMGRHPDVAFIMLTGVAEVNTAVECMQLGALDYLAKPMLRDEVRARVGKALEKRELTLQNRFYQQHLEARVRELDKRNKQAVLNAVQALVHALEAKDGYTSGHSLRVSRYARATALRLGIAGEALELIRLGGELHDIGKIGTREAVLNKPGPLTDEEFEHIKQHTVLGERILAPLVSESPVVLRIVRSHHERIDGQGFPDGLAGEEIPFEARIMAVADAFDAMTVDRAYRPARSAAEALAELKRCAGTHFDPAVVEAFVAEHTDLPLPVAS